MAGRPATLHGGASTLLYWVIVFAILWMLSLGLFIFQLVNNKAAENTAQNAERKIARYGNPPAYYVDEAQARRDGKVFAVMDESLRKLATLATGVAEDVAPTILEKAKTTLTGIADRKPGTVNPADTLLTAVEKLDQRHTEARDEADAAQASVTDLRAEKDRLTEQLKVTRDTFDAQVAEMRNTLRALEDEKTTAVRQKQTQVEALEETAKALKTQVVSMEREGISVVRDKDIEIGRQQTIVDTLQKQIQALKPSTFDPLAILTKADGRILRAVPGSDVVYINLGTGDKIKVGMGFEVFAPMRPAPPDLRGKASIEVVNVMEDTSECRITRPEPGQATREPVVEGDIIVNIAYERNRKPKFVVRGDFDLNYDGKVDFDGGEQVTNMIRQWGGQVVDKLDESVDFVVIGLSPSAQALPAGVPVSDVVKDQAQQKALQSGEFGALVQQAQRMYIPVITQNQFLFLLGYVRH